MNKIRKKDKVMVMAGSNKGEVGVVSQVILDSNGKPHKVVVDGVNMATHFVRPNPQKNEQGGLIKREVAIHASNVAVLDPATSTPARVKITKSNDGKKQRQFYVSQRRQDK